MVDRPFEWDAPRALLVALAAVVLVALVVAASTSSAAFGTYNPAWDGASELRDAARDVGSDVTVSRTTAAYDESTPEETIAVVLAPRERYSRTDAAVLRRFLEAGGTLVVADDFGRHADPLLAALGARSRIGGTLLRDEREFDRAPALPVATNVSAHPLTDGVETVTLNHASPVAPNGASVLVSTSGFAYADANRNGALDASETVGSYPVVAVEPVGEGTLVVAGDPSLFINVMLDRPGNARFVRNLFGARRAVLLDYSHAGPLPPLSVAVLVLRDSPSLQVLLGLGGLVLIGRWSRGPFGALARFRTARPSDRDPTLTAAQLVAYLEREHPDWDAHRVERVVRGIMSQRWQSRRDE